MVMATQAFSRAPQGRQGHRPSGQVQRRVEGDDRLRERVHGRRRSDVGLHEQLRQVPGESALLRHPPAEQQHRRADGRQERESDGLEEGQVRDRVPGDRRRQRGHQRQARKGEDPRDHVRRRQQGLALRRRPERQGRSYGGHAPRQVGEARVELQGRPRAARRRARPPAPSSRPASTVPATACSPSARTSRA